MPPADIPSGAERPHDDKPNGLEIDPVTADHLKASASSEPPIKIDEGEDPSGVIAEPPAIEAPQPSEGLPPPEEKEAQELPKRDKESAALSPPVKSPAQLTQEFREVHQNVVELRTEFEGEIAEEEAEHPSEETTADVVRTVRDIADRRPVHDAQPGGSGYERKEGQVIYSKARSTSLTDKTVGNAKVSAVIEFKEEVVFDRERADAESDESEPPVERLTIMLHSKSESEGESQEGYVEYSHEPKAANPWSKMEVRGGEITTFGAPTDAELRSMLPCLQEAFAHGEARVATEQREKEEHAAEGSKQLGEKAVALSESTELTDDEAFNNLLERVRTGEVDAEEVVNAQLQKLTQECGFPFAKKSTLTALYSLAEQLQPHLLEYDRMIVDDVSARVPSTIYHHLINEARTAVRLPRIRRFFVNGSLPAMGVDRLVKAYRPEARTLIFTEYSYTGASLQRLYDALKEREPVADVDIAIVGMDTQAPLDVRAAAAELLTFFVGRASHAGGGALDLLTSNLYPGVVKLPNEPEPRRWPDRYREQETVNRSREDARRIAQIFSRLLTLRQAASSRE